MKKLALIIVALALALATLGCGEGTVKEEVIQEGTQDAAKAKAAGGMMQPKGANE